MPLPYTSSALKSTNLQDMVAEARRMQKLEEWKRNGAAESAAKRKQAEASGAALEYAKRGLARSQAPLESQLQLSMPEQESGNYRPLQNFKDATPADLAQPGYSGEGVGGPEQPPNDELAQIEAELARRSELEKVEAELSTRSKTREPAPAGMEWRPDPLAPNIKGQAQESLSPIPEKPATVPVLSLNGKSVAGDYNPSVMEFLSKPIGDAAESIGGFVRGNNAKPGDARDVMGSLAQGVTGLPGALMERPEETIKSFSPIPYGAQALNDFGQAGSAAMRGDWGQAGKSAMDMANNASLSAMAALPVRGVGKAGQAAPGSKAAIREAGNTLATVVSDRPIRPQATKALTEILINSKVPRDRIEAGLRRIVQGLPQGMSREITIGQALLREFGEEFPQVVDNVSKVIRERGLSTAKNDESSTIVRNTTEAMRGSQSRFISESADKNLGGTARQVTRDDAAEEMARIGREQYEPILAQPIDSARAQAIDGVLNGPGMDELGKPLRQIAAGEGLDLKTFIAQDPVRAAHWMQHKARLLAEKEAGQNAPLATAYNKMRDRILPLLDDLTGPDGKTYAQTRKEYGDEAGIMSAAKMGDRFGAEVANPGNRDAFLRGFSELTTAQQEAGLASIRDWVKSKLQGAPVDAPARIGQLVSQSVLDTLDQLGPRGRALADDIRAIRSENEFLGGVSNKGQSATASNQEIMKQAPKLYSRGPFEVIGEGVKEAAGVMSGFNALKWVPEQMGRMNRPLNKTREDMTRMLMALQKADPGQTPKNTPPTIPPAGKVRTNEPPVTALPPPPQPPPVIEAPQASGLKFAAIRYKDANGRMQILRGKDHVEIEAIADKKFAGQDHDTERGFIGANGKFVSGMDAALDALSAGQIKDPQVRAFIESQIKAGKQPVVTSEMLDFSGKGPKPPKTEPPSSGGGTAPVSPRQQAINTHGPDRTTRFETPNGREYRVDFEKDGDAVAVDFREQGRTSTYRPTSDNSLADAKTVLAKVREAIEDDITRHARPKYVFAGETKQQRDLYQQIARSKAPPKGYRWEGPDKIGNVYLVRE